MDSLSAFAMGQSAKARGAKQMVFDWDKAAQLIRERKPTTAGAGLSGDWEYTGDTIYQDGKPVPAEDAHTYLSSNWATPELEMDGDTVDCWRYEEDAPGWGSDTYWPESALAILNAP